MRPLLLDTSVCVAAQRGRADEAGLLQTTPAIAVSPIVVGELCFGASLSADPIADRRKITAFLQSPRVRVLPIGVETARYYALIKTQLKRKGRPIPENDVWIAAGAMEHGLALLTHDRHFDHIDGLLLADDLAR